MEHLPHTVCEKTIRMPYLQATRTIWNSIAM